MHQAALCMFVLRSLQHLKELGKGTATIQESRRSRNLEPGEPEHRKAQCFAALSRYKEKQSCTSPGAGIAGALLVPPSVSTHPNKGAPAFTLCLSCNAWGPQRPEFWRVGTFCSQMLAKWPDMQLCHWKSHFMSPPPTYHLR